jgi:hypothetical protein
MTFSHLGEYANEIRFQGALQADRKVAQTKRRKPFPGALQADMNELGYAYS